jgi:hypothetical protein
MAITTRQTGLLVNQDWTKLYQTFRNADFQSYDYETLRKSMVDYLRYYYPEDFNDFIESSEFVALIDLIAFLGQSISFRGDLNARENFIDTAQRRDSVLKLAKLISYSPKRNVPASGFLKIDSISTTEVVYDSNGVNLSGLVINWADAGNDNWLEQFTAILNASFKSTTVIGKPAAQSVINGINTYEYPVNLVSRIIATYGFETNVEGTQTKFEFISPTTSGQSYVYEVAPKPNNPFNLLYKNDNLGNGSNDTGFFLYFKQGELKSQDFTFQESIPNRVYSINIDNVNNTDIWLYSLNNQGAPDALWTQVPAVGVTNVVYNKNTVKTIYQVSTRANDQIDIVFGDGSFAQVPQGNFRIYYRVGNGQNYKITPDEMQGIILPINYVSHNNRIETLNIRASLRYTVANASARETTDEIRQKAPQQYYTQDRMVTGEDYNILPYTLYNSILKVKAVNRTSSGVSRYLDVVDSTGKYSSTNIFCQDGILFKNPFTRSFSFEYNTKNDIYREILNNVAPIASDKETIQFYYSNFGSLAITNAFWQFSTAIDNGCTGYLYDGSGTYGSLLGKPLQVASSASGNNRYIKQNAIVKFSAGTGKYFDARNTIQTGTPSKDGDKLYLYATLELVVGDGTNNGAGNLSSGKGPITLNQVVPTGSVAVAVYPVFNIKFSSTVVDSMVGYIQGYEEFGLRYDITNSAWTIVLPQDLDTTNDFSLSSAGNTSSSGLDSSWIIRFKTVGQTYTVLYRGLEYIFQSVKETNFYFDKSVKNYDPTTNLTIRDQVKILKVNSAPDVVAALGLDYQWDIYNSIVESDGYESPEKILVTFPDTNNDGIPDNPELFETIINPTINTSSKYVYFQATYGYNNFVVQTPVSNNLVVSKYLSKDAISVDKTLYQNGQLFYVPIKNEFYKLSVLGQSYTLVLQTAYTAKIGRQDLYFQYRHNSPNYRRIDPSPNNIIDLYILKKQYATDYLAWIQDTSGKVKEPSTPTSEELSTEFSNLEKYKSISDTLIYNPVKFKPIFGAKAESSLRATFKVIKNPNVVVSDSDVKTSVIAAINNYFNLANWDFGETFYFSELSTYLHNALAPNIASIIIVPYSTSTAFGQLMQINAEYNEIITSAATVDNVQIISAITAAQLNQA